jgi:oxygen-dependent protoporphyrinogen oxidase
MLRCGHGLSSILGRRVSQYHICRALPPCFAKYFSSEPPPSHDVAVLGGGITGLACAYYLTRELPRAKVTIYEASDRLGGWLSSTRVPVQDGSVLFEAGPRTLRPSSNGALAAQLVWKLSISNFQIEG